MKKEKQLWLLAGGNGAGKTTFYRLQLESFGIPFVNADILAKQLHPDQPEQHSYEAAKITETIRLHLLQDGRTFCFETVFSHPSKIDFVANAKAMEYEIALVFIHLGQLQLNFARIAQRMSEGGHTVPDDKVKARIPRVLQLVKQVLPLCDHVSILDNSRADSPFQQIGAIRNGCLELNQVSIPGWCRELLSDYS
ncbi:Predicted ABC-type ATPase [Nitrosomonas sp. Nm51]|uniref:zeta toxin family protein n=1 Tax=Nitrosomonas sp. Nm51 TaxID=133720 RepID=UPI0008C9694C|nr:AAA family ATPase [Nitrosomonas sp. Nm51]SER18016.1 Predicted ABC-type ATPase [Nitrosomonas sp. Nm51]